MEPSFTFADMTSFIAYEWKDMDPSRREHYMHLAKVDKKRYKKEKKAYLAAAAALQ